MKWSKQFSICQTKTAASKKRIFSEFFLSLAQQSTLYAHNKKKKTTNKQCRVCGKLVDCIRSVYEQKTVGHDLFEQARWPRLPFTHQPSSWRRHVEFIPKSVSPVNVRACRSFRFSRIADTNLRWLSLSACHPCRGKLIACQLRYHHTLTLPTFIPNGNGACDFDWGFTNHISAEVRWRSSPPNWNNLANYFMISPMLVRRVLKAKEHPHDIQQ